MGASDIYIGFEMIFGNARRSLCLFWFWVFWCKCDVHTIVKWYTCMLVKVIADAQLVGALLSTRFVWLYVVELEFQKKWIALCLKMGHKYCTNSFEFFMTIMLEEFSYHLSFLAFLSVVDWSLVFTRVITNYIYLKL